MSHEESSNAWPLRSAPGHIDVFLCATDPRLFLDSYVSFAGLTSLSLESRDSPLFRSRLTPSMLSDARRILQMMWPTHASTALCGLGATQRDLDRLVQL